MRYVQVVGQQELQRVLSRGAGELGLRAAITEMDVVLVCRDRQAKGRQPGVNDQVVVAAARVLITRRQHLHALQAELQSDRIRNHLTIGRHYEKHLRAVN